MAQRHQSRGGGYVELCAESAVDDTDAVGEEDRGERHALVETPVRDSWKRSPASYGRLACYTLIGIMLAISVIAIARHFLIVAALPTTSTKSAESVLPMKAMAPSPMTPSPLTPLLYEMRLWGSVCSATPVATPWACRDLCVLRAETCAGMTWANITAQFVGCWLCQQLTHLTRQPGFVSWVSPASSIGGGFESEASLAIEDHESRARLGNSSMIAEHFRCEKGRVGLCNGTSDASGIMHASLCEYHVEHSCTPDQSLRHDVLREHNVTLIRVQTSHALLGLAVDNFLTNHLDFSIFSISKSSPSDSVVLLAREPKRRNRVPTRICPSLTWPALCSAGVNATCRLNPRTRVVLCYRRCSWSGHANARFRPSATIAIFTSSGLNVAGGRLTPAARAATNGPRPQS